MNEQQQHTHTRSGGAHLHAHALARSGAPVAPVRPPEEAQLVNKNVNRNVCIAIFLNIANQSFDLKIKICLTLQRNS